MITVSINGKPHQFDFPVTVTELTERLGFSGKRIAIECNGEIIPRSQFPSRQLANGDRLEIVVAVGGG